MKQKIISKIKFIKYTLTLAALFVPVLASAQSNAVTGGLQNATGLQSLFGTGGLNNSQSLSDLIVNVVRLLLTFSGVIAILFVIIGGFQYVTSGGNEETAEKGKKTVINAIIGIILIILSYVIINVIANTVSSNSGYGF